MWCTSSGDVRETKIGFLEFLRADFLLDKFEKNIQLPLILAINYWKNERVLKLFSKSKFTLFFLEVFPFIYTDDCLTFLKV